MQIQTEQLGGLILFQLSGDIDHASAPELYETMNNQLPELIEEGVFLDLTEVPYVDSAGLGVLSKLLTRCSENGWMGVISPSRGVFRLFEISGITTRQNLVVLKDREAAAKYLEDLNRPRVKQERPRVSKLVEGEEWEEEEETEEESGSHEDEAPVWGDDPSPSWERKKDSGW